MTLAQIPETPTVPVERDHANPGKFDSRERPCEQDILHVSDLSVEIAQAGAKPTRILDKISVRIQKGQAIGILGESGCGKTTLARALIRLLPSDFRFVGGSIECQGTDILPMTAKELTRIRGAVISLIHQEPAGALHPTMRIGHQVGEILRAHHSWSRKKCKESARAVLGEVFTKDIGRICDSYPHELSGGQRQRVLIAQAISCRPSMIIADEPTASLDLTTQAEIIQLLKGLRQAHGMALILITHNPSLLRGLVDRVLVMHSGQIVEEGTSEDIFTTPLHPYTQDLMRLRTHPNQDRRLNHGQRLRLIEAISDEQGPADSSCRYERRCGRRMPICASTEPEEKYIEAARRVRCFLYER